MTRPELPSSVCVDSCCVIALLGGEPAAPAVQSVIDAASARHLQLYASTLILVEARGRGANGPDADPVLESGNLDRLLQPYWTYVETDREVALKARQLASRHKLDAADAVHLASAVVAGAEVFMTLDADDFPIGTTIDGVWIDKPYPPLGPTIFDDLG